MRGSRTISTAFVLALLLACAGPALAGEVAPSLSAAEDAVPVRQIPGLETAMRDGVKLASDVWLPAADGKYPVILIRTPYLKGDRFFRGAETGAWFAKRGYAVVIQDVRGRGESGGDFNFFF